MNIEKLITELGKNMAEALLDKEEESSERISLNDIGSGDLLEIILRRLVKNGDYNKAENILFEAISKNNSQEIFQTALNFYNLLLEKSDEELKKGDFSREEVYQGLNDVKKKFEK